MDKTHSNMIDEEFTEVVDENPDLRPPEPKNDVVVNTLVLGVNDGLSDIMMVVRYNKENHKMAIVSVPRDTKVNITGYAEGKINSIISKNDGVPLVMKTVGELLDIPIHHYIRINLSGAEKIVDTIGGVKINVPIPMHYDDPYQDLHIHIDPGEQVLNGKKAVQFIRFRSGYTDQDLGRIKAQHEFIKAFVKKLTSPAMLPKALTVINTMSKYVKTNLEEGEIASYALGVKNLKLDNISQYTIPGKALTINGIAYFIHDKDELAKMMHEVDLALDVDNSVAALQGSNAVNSQQSNPAPTIDKKNIRIEILNSTKSNGLAASMKTQLEALGYTVIKIGDTKDLTFNTSRLINRNGHEETAQIVAQDIGLTVIETDIDNSLGCDITIIIGKDRQN